MQDRQALVDAVGCATREQDLKDTIDLIELGELEDDEEVVKSGAILAVACESL